MRNTRTLRSRTLAATTAGSFALAALAGGIALAPTASAKDLEVRASGSCTSGTWKLKAKQQDRSIETEFELDTNRVGQSWRVSLSDNAVVVWSGTKITTAPSGSFGARRIIANRVGSDVIRATATNTISGAVCRGAVTYPG